MNLILHQTVDELAHLGAGERHRVVVELNDTRAPVAADPLHRQMEAHARRTPDAPAVVHEGTVVGYGELDRRAGAVARRLRGLGLRPEERVALLLDRSPDVLVALFGVLKAGGAYMPLEPSLPPERTAGLLADAGTRFVLTQESLLGAVPGGYEPLLVRDARQDPPGDVPDDADVSVEQPRVRAVHLRLHRAAQGRRGGAPAARRLRARLHPRAARAGGRRRLRHGVDLRGRPRHTALFGVALLGRMPARGLGRARAGPGRIPGVLPRHRIDYLKIAPSHLAALLAGADPAGVLPRRALGARRGGVVVGADRPRAGSCAPGLRVLNHYGPTETTVGVLDHDCRPPGGSPPRTGCRSGGRCPTACARPGRGLRTGAGRARPASSTWAARGWRAATWAGRTLTAERFVPDPLARSRRAPGCTARATWAAAMPTARSSSWGAPTTRSRSAASAWSSARSRRCCARIPG